MYLHVRFIRRGPPFFHWVQVFQGGSPGRPQRRRRAPSWPPRSPAPPWSGGCSNIITKVRRLVSAWGDEKKMFFYECFFYPGAPSPAQCAGESEGTNLKGSNTDFVHLHAFGGLAGRALPRSGERGQTGSDALEQRLRVATCMARSRQASG